MTERHIKAILALYETVYITKMVCISVVKWVKPQSTDLQAPSSNPAGTFVFIISGKILKVDFPPKIEYFFLSFSSPTQVSLFYYSILFIRSSPVIWKILSMPKMDFVWRFKKKN